MRETERGRGERQRHRERETERERGGREREGGREGERNTERESGRESGINYNFCPGCPQEPAPPVHHSPATTQSSNTMQIRSTGVEASPCSKSKEAGTPHCPKISFDECFVTSGKHSFSKESLRPPRCGASVALESQQCLDELWSGSRNKHGPRESSLNGPLTGL